MNRITNCIAVLCCIVLCSPVYGQNSKWKLTKYSGNSFEQLWVADSHHIAANECGDAYWDAPIRSDLKSGDCWTVHIPVSNLKAGTYVELDLEFGNESESGSSFAFEYMDGNKWICIDTVNCTGLYNTPNSVIETFRVSRAVRKGEILARLRALGDTAPGSTFKLMPYGYIGGYCSVLGTAAPVDTVRIGWVGNSFTFVNSADFILKELAWHEGHYLDLNVSTYPGAFFRTHLGLRLSMDVISAGGYDWFILQDQSTQAARFGRDSTVATAQFTKAISQVIRYFSPDVRILLEQTWAFSQDKFGGFGSFEEFDANSTHGVRNLARIADASISPIAAAFAIVRDERPALEIYSTDDHHPAAYGAYLKACVNYLSIFQSPFKSDKANFGLDPEVCAYLRDVAERTVFRRAQ